MVTILYKFLVKKSEPFTPQELFVCLAIDLLLFVAVDYFIG